jgi:hypothetical protein
MNRDVWSTRIAPTREHRGDHLTKDGPRVVARARAGLDVLCGDRE